MQKISKIAKRYLYTASLFLVTSMFCASVTQAQQLCGTDGSVVKSDDIYTMAVLGNTRPAFKQDAMTGKIGQSKGVFTHLSTDIVKTHPQCVVLVGDMVPGASAKNWKKFQSAMSVFQDTPIQPVMGDMEALKDEKYLQTQSVFPEMGTDIGYNRVGSWDYFDVQSKDTTWRIMTLDANKTILKSRWNEQLLWIDEAIKGEYDAMIIFVHLPWYNLAGSNPQMNPDDAPRELITYVEESLGMMKLKAVVFGGGHANQVIMPDGAFGTLYVGAGGGGAPAEDLYLWQPGFEHNMTKKIELEKTFRQVLLKEVDRWNSQSPLSASTMDKAFNTGTYKDFPGLIEGSQFPIQGWWELIIDGGYMGFLYHQYYQNESLNVIYRITYSEQGGWIPKIP